MRQLADVSGNIVQSNIYVPVRNWQGRSAFRDDSEYHYFNVTSALSSACPVIHARTVCVNKFGKIVTPECSSRASIALTRTHCQSEFWIPAKGTRE